ncbi:hypothetical protein CBP51_07260 [Cellvibrio mixtus]|uniref:Uncharacterized protein n=1 Tax=Cellvibrio mixtus TaxID=39650 RepID=A0A266QAA8_9GAMM|nr:hypothetical protein CBP51_07260 [Cellvibrio mixtus]
MVVIFINQNKKTRTGVINQSMRGKFNSQTTYVCKKRGIKKRKLHTYAKAKNMKKSNTLCVTQQLGLLGDHRQAQNMETHASHIK